MSTTRKNDETALIAYEQSWIANLQRRLGWIKTQEIEVNASPSSFLPRMLYSP